jgi:hypothetical protein
VQQEGIERLSVHSINGLLQLEGTPHNIFHFFLVLALITINEAWELCLKGLGRRENE